jgi:nascent polypeptide-associated complex subunit beta
MSLICYIVGTQRRTKKVVHHQEVNEDKKLKSTIKKFGMQPLQDIDEVNMFKEDNTIMHLKRPTSKSFLNI